jgi:hypothetical protein
MGDTSIIEKDTDLLNSVYDKYFGEKALLDFQNKFKNSKRQLELFEDSEIPRSQLTPRYMYLREVEKMQGLPLPLYLRKESDPFGLYFGKRGLGVSDVDMGLFHCSLFVPSSIGSSSISHRSSDRQAPGHPHCGFQRQSFDGFDVDATRV